MAILDSEEAVWLAELIGQAVLEMAHSPGLTIEVSQDEQYWVQILPVPSEQSPDDLGHFLLNFPYRGYEADPLEMLQKQGLPAPPGTESASFQANHFATLTVRSDVPLLGLAHFAGDLLERVVGAPADSAIAVQIDYGY